MNNWEQCRNYGVIRMGAHNTVLLYYNQFSYSIAGNPMFLHVEDACWQGQHLILRGKDSYGIPKVYIMDGFNSYRQII
jgi:hypothetical protein